MSDYKVDVVNSIKDILACDTDTDVELVGTIGAIMQESEKTKKGLRPVSVIQVLVDGGAALVRVTNPRAVFAGGNFDNIVGKPLAQDDVISVQAKVMDSEYALFDAGENGIYLSVPSFDRIDQEDREREDVNEKLYELTECIRTAHFVEAREIFADLRTRKLTGDEQEELATHIDDMPQSEQPVHLAMNIPAAEINRVYDFNPETMNKDQFLLFAHSVFDGIITPVDSSENNILKLVLMFIQYQGLNSDEICNLIENYLAFKERKGAM